MESSMVIRSTGHACGEVRMKVDAGKLSKKVNEGERESERETDR